MKIVTMLLLSLLVPPCIGQQVPQRLSPEDDAFLLIQEGPLRTTAWDLRLSADTTRGLPATLELAIHNRGDIKLKGKSIAFSIHLEHGMYGWGIDETLHAEEVVVEPRSSIKRTIRFEDLEFKDCKGNLIPQQVAHKKLALTKWHISATLMNAPNSNPSIFSNTTSFEPGTAKPGA